MKVFITGAHGYIGTNLRNMLIAAGIDAACVSVRGGELPDLRGCDAVVHCAGVVHKKADKKTYEEVNVNLTRRLANAAVAVGVRQFVFLSTMAVYGDTRVIDARTAVNPANDYGRSKLAAERALQNMEGDNFIVSIIRPPMVTGENCPGNYARLVKYSKFLPIFPNVRNFRSAVRIDTLCKLILLVLLKKAPGIFFPQERSYICTAEEIKKIRAARRKGTRLSNFLEWIIRRHPKLGSGKIFGTCVYAQALSTHFENKYR